VCTIQDSNKITCLLDYGNNPITTTTTTGSAWCTNTPNTIYIETTYIYKCTAAANTHTLLYTVRDKPSCYYHDDSSPSCYNGYDNDIITNIERQKATELILDDLLLESSSSSTKISNEWGDSCPWDTCVEIRFNVSDPIFSIINSEDINGTTDDIDIDADINADSPTVRGECQDDSIFTFEGDAGKDCFWALESPKKRCKKKDSLTKEKVKDSCPSVCKGECANSPSVSPGGEDGEDNSVSNSDSALTLVPFDEEEEGEDSSSSVPTVTSQPSLRPSFSDTPTISPGPTRQPTVLSCKDESLNIIQHKQKQNYDDDDDDDDDVAVQLK
jgi:hypothetical protein